MQGNVIHTARRIRREIQCVGKIAEGRNQRSHILQADARRGNLQQQLRRVAHRLEVVEGDRSHLCLGNPHRRGRQLHLHLMQADTVRIAHHLQRQTLQLQPRLLRETHLLDGGVDAVFPQGSQRDRGTQILNAEMFGVEPARCFRRIANVEAERPFTE